MCGDVEQYHPSGHSTSYNYVSVIMYGSVIYHSQNNDAGAFIFIEDNKKNSPSVHEAKIAPVFGQWNIFVFDSRFSKTLYR